MHEIQKQETAINETEKDYPSLPKDLQVNAGFPASTLMLLTLRVISFPTIVLK